MRTGAASLRSGVGANGIWDSPVRAATLARKSRFLHSRRSRRSRDHPGPCPSTYRQDPGSARLRAGRRCNRSGAQAGNANLARDELVHAEERGHVGPDVLRAPTGRAREVLELAHAVLVGILGVDGLAGPEVEASTAGLCGLVAETDQMH